MTLLVLTNLYVLNMLFEQTKKYSGHVLNILCFVLINLNVDIIHI